jgi:hypothetical protein
MKAQRGAGSMDGRHSAVIIKNQTTSIIEDTYLLAALLTFDPSIKYYPKRDSTGNVSFEVIGKISDKMGLLYSGEMASLKTYIANLKMLRSVIFALKNSSKPGSVSARKGYCRDIAVNSK